MKTTFEVRLTADEINELIRGLYRIEDEEERDTLGLREKLRAAVQRQQTAGESASE